MKTLLNILLAFIVFLFAISCSKSIKDEDSVRGHYYGKATVSSNNVAKNIDIDIKSETSPVSGTYVFDSKEGNITGTALGLIYTIKLTPKDAGGVIYNADFTWDGEKTISGTMKGVEGGKTVTYNLLLNR